MITLNNPSKLNALTGKYPYFKDYIVDKPTETQTSIPLPPARAPGFSSKDSQSQVFLRDPDVITCSCFSV